MDLDDDRRNAYGGHRVLWNETWNNGSDYDTGPSRDLRRGFGNCISGGAPGNGAQSASILAVTDPTIKGLSSDAEATSWI